MKRALGQLRRRRCGERMPQQALRRHHDERQRIGLEQQRLAPQQMEVLRRRRAVGDAHVGVGGGVEEALEPRARVVRPLAFVAVGQQQHQRRRHAPLRAARGHVFVEDDLRAVDEVAVLRFPQHQTRRLLQVVAELEADARVFGQRAVADFERRLCLRQRLQRECAPRRSPRRDTRAWRWLKVPRSTSSPVNRIGTRVGEDRRHRELFRCGPVDRSAPTATANIALRRSRPRSSLRCTVKPSGTRHQRCVDRLQRIKRARRCAPSWRRRLAAPPAPAGRSPVPVAPTRTRCSSSVIRDCTSASALSCVIAPASTSVFAYCSRTVGMRGDDLIDLRLRERRLVALVVAVLPIADEVDQVIQLESLAIGDGEPRRFDARDRIVGVDVRDRHLEAARQAAGVAGAERLLGIGREAELIVGDDVNDAANVVALEAREVERLGDDALSGKSGIAVNQNRQDLALVDDRRARPVGASSPRRAPCRSAPGRPLRDGSGWAASR